MPFTRQPIVVGVDGSASALVAARWAAREAALRSVPLRLVTALGWAAVQHLGDAGPGPGYLYDVLREAARGRLAVADAAAREAVADVSTEQEVRDGDPVPVLTEESTRTALLVVGDRGRGGFPGLVAGSTAVALAARASCPLVVVRGPVSAVALPGAAPVVIGVDSSPTSDAALAFAFAEASLRGAPLVAVHTWIDQALDPAMAPLLSWDAVETEERRVLAARVAGWSANYPQLEVRCLINRDRPANTLVELSAGAQLVVVGTRGRKGLTATLLGSVSRALIQHAQCPIAVVRPDGHVGR